jgi:hypothetical protein
MYKLINLYSDMMENKPVSCTYKISSYLWVIVAHSGTRMFHNTFILLIILIYWGQKNDKNDGLFPSVVILV